MSIKKYKNTRYWALYDVDNALICVTVYKKGAENVKRRIQGIENEKARNNKRKKNHF